MNLLRFAVVLVLMSSLVHGDDVPRNNPLMHFTFLSIPSKSGEGKYDQAAGYNVTQPWPDGTQLMFSMKLKTADTPLHWYVNIKKEDNTTDLVLDYVQPDPYHVAVFSPDARDPALFPNFDYTLELVPGEELDNATFTTGVSNITFAQLWLDGSSFWKNGDNPICPGYIYYYVEAPKDQTYAYNFTLQAQYWSVTFSDLWVRAGDWPTNETYDYHYEDMTIFEMPEPLTIAIDSLHTGQWFLMFKCKVKKAIADPYWQVGAYLDPTCLKSCFYTGGTCYTNAPTPYCTCSRWFKDGQVTCTFLFDGDYTLMVLAVVLFISILVYTIYKVRACCKNRTHPDEIEFGYGNSARPLERQRLIGSSEDL